jgi:hypothetical protein
MDRFGAEPDVLEGGSALPVPRRWAPWVAGVAVASVAGLLGGYAIGHRGESRTGPSPATMTSATTSPPPTGRPSGSPPLVQTGATCSIQHGHRLQLGVQVENQSSSVVHISGVTSREPLGGLHRIDSGLGPCGEIRGQAVSFDSSAVVPGAATWLTATVHVLVRCPTAYPVQLVLRYGQGAGAGAEKLPGFVDLGHVPYTGCARDQ